MIGKRIADGELPENPGEYSKHIVGGRVVWWLIVPTGGSPVLLGRPNKDGSPHHEIEENADGTITVRPNPPANPGSTNSILWNDWHGYIYDGRWEKLA